MGKKSKSKNNTTPAPQSPAPSNRPKEQHVLRAEQRKRNNLFLGIGAAVVVVAALAFYLVPRGGLDGIEGVRRISLGEVGHRTGTLEYSLHPPAGGLHNPSWQNCGIYDRPVLNEFAVHSLEHGAVWIAYRPDLPQTEIDALRRLVNDRRYTLLAPYDAAPLSSPIVATAWGLQLELQNATDPRLGQFLTRYIQGSQTPEPGAICSAGFGTPID